MLSDSKSKEILTASSDMKIHYWTYSNGKLSKSRSLEGHHKDAIRKLCIQEDYLYSVDESGEVNFFANKKSLCRYSKVQRARHAHVDVIKL